MTHTRSNDDDTTPAPATAAAPRLSGTIRRLQSAKGYGFLSANGRDYFFHRTALDPPSAFDALHEGTTVTFVATEGEKGLRAEQVIAVVTEE